MAQYVDGFVVPVPVAQLAAYRKMARKAGKVWREHGAVEYVVGDALHVLDRARREGDVGA